MAIDEVYEEIRRFAANRGVRLVMLFGSRARGDNAAKSDIDLAYAGGDAAGFEDDVKNRLWSLLEVDTVNLDAPISDELRTEIARDGKVLYEAV